MNAPTIRTVVEATIADTSDVKVISLRPLSDIACTYRPGSHIDLHLPCGLLRPYSLINPQSQAEAFRIAVKRDAHSRGGSQFVHDELKAGDTIEISGPRSTFSLAEGAAHSVFVAGGIGITPFLSLMERAELEGLAWDLHYSCRTEEGAPLLGEVRALAGRSRGGRLSTYFTREDRGRADIGAIVAAAAPGTHFYCCGPQPMIDAFRSATAGLAADRVHSESFSNDNAKALDGGYTAVLARSGLTLEVPPGKSLLDAILDAGLEPDHSCCEGCCGSCEVRVLEGVPDHRDVVLSPDERAANDRMMICCSGSLTPRLVLDL